MEKHPARIVEGRSRHYLQKQGILGFPRKRIQKSHRYLTGDWRSPWTPRTRAAWYDVDRRRKLKLWIAGNDIYLFPSFFESDGSCANRICFSAGSSDAMPPPHRSQRSLSIAFRRTKIKASHSAYSVASRAIKTCQHGALTLATRLRPVSAVRQVSGPCVIEPCFW